MEKTKYRATRISNNSDWYLLEYCVITKFKGFFGRKYTKENWYTIPEIKYPKTSDFGKYPFQVTGTTYTIENFIKKYPNIELYLEWVKKKQIEVDEERRKEKKYWRDKLERDHPKLINY